MIHHDARLRRILMIVFGVLLITYGHGTTAGYYVDPQGSNSNSCQTSESGIPSEAQRTVENGIACMTQTGDNLNIAPGSGVSYKFLVRIDDDGSAGTPDIYTDFSVSSQSPAINAGCNLLNPASDGNCPVGMSAETDPGFSLDFNGSARPSSGPWTIGAIEFGGVVIVPPSPLGNFATYTFDENTGTAAGDTSGQNHTLTLSSAGWGPPIIGIASFATNGSRFASVPLAAGMVPPQTVGLVGWWNGSSPAECDFISLGDSAAIRLHADGSIMAFFFNGSTWVNTPSVSANVFNGQSRMLWMTKSPTAVRVGVDTIQLGGQAVTGTITYTLGNQLTIGMHGNGEGRTCPTGRIDMVRLFDTELTPTAIQNLYNEQVPASGFSVTHQAFFEANLAEGSQVGTTDTDRDVTINTKLGLRSSIHKADAGSITEHFRPYCRVFSGGTWGAWSELTNSFGTLPLRYLADTAVTQGQATSVLLPTDGFTGVPGKFLINPIDLTSPYDASQRMTIGQGEQAEQEIRLELDPTATVGSLIQCQPQRETGAPFPSYSTLPSLHLIDPPTADILMITSASPAINAGTCLASVPEDIRGIIRPQGSSCDMGAYESTATPPPISTISRRTGVGSQGVALR